MARALINDVDSTNPFTTDTALYSFIDDWGIDLAIYLVWPRSSSTFAVAVGDGPNAGSIVNPISLAQDTISILSAYFENTTTNAVSRLRPRTEIEMQGLNPAWRYPSGQALPAFYVILDSPTEGTTNWPQQKITIDSQSSEARTLRIHYLQAPAASTTGTNSPIFQAHYHKSGVYYMCYQAVFPRHPDKAQYFWDKYIDERRRAKSLAPENMDPSIEIWDMVQLMGNGVQFIIGR